MAKSFIKSHQWMERKDEVAFVGISEHASIELGGVTYVELPEVGRVLQAGEAFGSIESTKAANELFTPIAGTVVAVNTELETTPEIVNDEPEGKGWIIQLGNLGETAADLMTAEEYQEFIKG